jgi:hypothetical protein
MDAGDQRPDDADVRRAQLAGADVNDSAACEQQVERLQAARRSYRV